MAFYSSKYKKGGKYIENPYNVQYRFSNISAYKNFSKMIQYTKHTYKSHASNKTGPRAVDKCGH